MVTFRDLLDSLCRSRGVSYAELARRVGVTRSYIGQLIHGHVKPPPPERCQQFADALELSPAERQQIIDLAVRERARVEARVKIEELDSAVDALCSAAADLLVGMISNMAREGEALPEAVAGLFAREPLLAELYGLVTAGTGDPRAAVAARLSGLSPERVAAELNALAETLRGSEARGTRVEGEEEEVVEAGGFELSRPALRAPRFTPPRPIPVIGYVAAGETDIAFTDAGLPTGAGLPGEDPIPRWPGAGEHAYALRITGESMMPLCPPGTTIVVDPDRTPRGGEPAICQTTDGKTYFKLVHFEAGGRLRLVSTNQAVAADIVLGRPQVRRLQKVIATIYP